MTLIALPAHLYQRQRWRNGLGWTREIWRSGEGPAWRVSIAEIDADCEFSSFPDCRRQLRLLAGAGLCVQINAQDPTTLALPFAALDFNGDDAVAARLIDGPVQALNLIHRPDAIDARLLHRPLLGSMLFFLRPGQTWLLHLAAGQARLREGNHLLELAAGDSALLFGDAGRVQLEGGGDLLLVQVDSRPQPATQALLI
jgi:environmental stress-induced protein Ves